MQNKTIKMLFLFAILTIFGANQSYSQVVLIAPADQAKCVTMQPTFSWNNIADLDHFTLYVSETPTFHIDSTFSANVGKDTVAAFATAFPSKWLNSNKTYYWKVVGTTNGETTVNSLTYSFLTETDAVLPMEPSNDQCCLDKEVEFVVETFYPKVDTLRFLIAKDRGFTNIVIDTILTNVTITNFRYSIKLNMPDYAKEYYWVPFQNMSGCWADTLAQFVNKFCTRPGEVSLATPAHDSKGIPMFESGLPFNVNLKWHPIANALNYVVTIANNSLFDNAMQYWSADTNLTITLPQEYNKTYFWKVAANVPPITIDGEDYDTCSSLSSQAWRFKVPYNKVLLSYPGDGDRCIPMIHTASWEPIQDANYYHFQIATTVDFADTTIVYDRDSIDQASTIVELPTGLTRYYWRVRVENSFNTGLWSNVRFFESTAETPQDINPLTASAGVDRNLTLKWAAGKVGTSFQLKIYSDTALEVVLLDTLLNTNTFTYFFENFNYKYYWQVKAFYDDCQSDWSNAYTFKTKIAPPFNLIPADDATKVDPFLITLKWTGSEGSELYDLDFSDDSTFAEFTRFERSIESNTVIYGDNKENAQYWWRVRAKNTEGVSDWSVVNSFTTGYIMPAVPVLTTPSSGDYKLPLTLNLCWLPANRAITYKLQVSDYQDFTNILVSVDTLTNTCFEISGLENNKTYYWRVASINLGGMSGYSLVSYFKTAPLAPSDKTLLVSPQNGVEKLTTKLQTLTWESTPNADFYELVVAKDADFTDIFYQNTKVWNAYKAIMDLPGLTKLYWRVRGVNDGGTGPWSDTWSFTTEDPASVINAEDVNIVIYPEPVSNTINLKMDENNSYSNIELIDANGKVIVTYSVNNQTNLLIDVTSVSSGVYFLKFNGTDKPAVYKVMIQK